jgi:hypothetical protein
MTDLLALAVVTIVALICLGVLTYLVAPWVKFIGRAIWKGRWIPNPRAYWPFKKKKKPGVFGCISATEAANIEALEQARRAKARRWGYDCLSAGPPEPPIQFQGSLTGCWSQETWDKVLQFRMTADLLEQQRIQNEKLGITTQFDSLLKQYKEKLEEEE